VSPVKYELGIYVPEDGILQLITLFKCSRSRKKYVTEYISVDCL
jgi:hypothetical protein